jgi:alkanesulfonate monooxygenase SsuD/methylene tetrahydromethanopterin reductase-like flavin-dependent oxidoreductase (luciferase family)
LSFVKLRQGRPGVLPSPEEAAAYDWTPSELAFAEQRLGNAILGSPSEVRQQLDALLAQTQVDELMVVTSAHAIEDRLRSYELLMTEAAAGR